MLAGQVPFASYPVQRSQRLVQTIKRFVFVFNKLHTMHDTLHIWTKRDGTQDGETNRGNWSNRNVV